MKSLDAARRLVNPLWEMNLLPHNVDDSEEFKEQVASIVRRYFPSETRTADKAIQK